MDGALTYVLYMSHPRDPASSLAQEVVLACRPRDNDTRYSALDYRGYPVAFFYLVRPPRWSL